MASGRSASIERFQKPRVVILDNASVPTAKALAPLDFLPP